MGAKCCTPAVDDLPLAQDNLELKFNPEKVNHLWIKSQKNSAQASARVTKIIEAADANKDGELDYNESLRVCRNFLNKTSDRGGKPLNDEDLQGVFTSLDTNDDGKLNIPELEMAIKAMWLMNDRGISIDDLRGEWDGPPPAYEDQTEKRDVALSKENETLKKTQEKLSRKKVEQVWKTKRSEDAEGPDAAAVQRVMAKSKKQGKKMNNNGPNIDNQVKEAFNEDDTNHDGALSRTEAARISKAFLKKAGMAHGRIEEVFDMLDTNSDNVLDKDEIALAMKAMWLMSTDHVLLSELLEEFPVP